MAKLSWVEDFSMVRGREIEDIILKLGNAKGFVEQSNQHFIAAAKGLGKTLLLIDKRRDLQNKHTENRDKKTYTDVHFIPSAEPFLDIMSGERNVSKAEKKFFADLNNSKKVWSFALKLSLFTYRVSDFTKDFLGLDYEIAILKKITGGRPLNPTDVFRSLFSFLEISSIHALIDKIDPLLERDLNKIRDANYIFIDAVDQSISQLSQESWVNFQAGMIEASFDLMRSNQHVKVYASIRIEAFANYNSPTKANVSGYTTKLFYDKSELYDILNHLSGFYEESMNIDEFFGHKVISKKQQGVQEKPFNYLIRHTLSTPRELVHICRGLSECAESSSDESVFRQIVNERSANHLPNIFHELRPILKTLNTDNDVDKFMGLLSKNILEYRTIKEITRSYNGYDRETDIDIEHLENPFLDLYNCGLLGVIDSSIETPAQRFHTPSNPSKKSQLSLPQSDYYFVHPSLQSMVKNQNPQYKVINSIVIGQNLPWYEWNQYLVEMEELIDQLLLRFDGKLLKPIRTKTAIALSRIGNNERFEEAINELLSALENFKASDVFDEEIKLDMDFLSDQFVENFRQHHIGI